MDDLKEGTLVGEDKYGNKYYENKRYFYGKMNFEVLTTYLDFYNRWILCFRPWSLGSLQQKYWYWIWWQHDSWRMVWLDAPQDRYSSYSGKWSQKMKNFEYDIFSWKWLNEKLTQHPSSWHFRVRCREVVNMYTTTTFTQT